ncbi:MAG: GerAB/ArcD/ProY family transporter [Sporolactobacillus sp.]
MNNKINETHQVGPLSVFFFTNVMQIGIGFLSFQQIVTRFGHQDAWLSITLSGLSTLGVMWLILRLLENESHYGRADLFSIQYRIFGKWIGGLLNFLMLFHVFVFAVTFLRSYIEILQVWLFPQLPMLSFSILFCAIIWYVVMGGIRSISGVTLLSFIYMIPLFLSCIFVVPQAHLSNLLPIFDNNPKSIIISCFYATRNFLGFELILYYYPFIKQPKEAKKWAYFGLLTTLYIYLMVIILGILYFSRNEMQNTIWPTITFWKSVHFPLIEHIDIICIILLLWNLIPNISLCSWILTRGIKFTFPSIKMKYSLIAVLILFIIINECVQNGLQVKQLNDFYSLYGFCIIYFYIPLLLLAQWLKKKWGQHAT